MRSTTLTTALVIITLIAIQSAAATPVQWPTSSGGNGHWYEVIQTADSLGTLPTDGLFWPTACDTAEARVWEGHGGFLATITTEEENSFITDLLPSGSISGFEFWLGGFKIGNGQGPAEDWAWREPSHADWDFADWDFTKWAPGEPNGSTATERYLVIYADTNARRGEWNDSGGGNRAYGYVVEYVPEPSTALFLLSACMLLPRQRR